MPRSQIIDQYEPVILEENEGEKSYRETVEDIMRAFESSEDDHNWEIRVFLVRGPAKKGFKQPWLFNCSPEDLPIDERLGKEYGEGLYRCSVYHNGQLIKGFHREIGPAPKSAGQSAQDKSELGLLIQTIREENQRSNEMFGQILSRLAAAPTAPAVNPMEMVVSMITALKGLNDLAPKPTAAEGGGTSMKDAIEIFKSGVELAQNATGGGGETGLGDIIKTLIQSPVLENVLNRQTQPAGQMNYVQPYPPNWPRGQYGGPQPIAKPQTANPPVLPADPSKLTQEQTDQIIRAQLGFLVGCAKSNLDPALYAEVILDQMPAPALEHILSSPAIVDELATINPEIATVRHWFDRLLAEMRQMVQADAAESKPQQPGPRNGIGPSGSPAQ